MKKLALLLVIFAFGLQSIMAQTKEISGTVTSAGDGDPIPGVSVSVKGTSLGTITDFDGKYIIRVPQNAATLVFSFVGMKTSEMPISGTSMNVQLEEDMIGVDEVVVVGYGTTTKQSFVGSVKTVKNESIQSKSVSNLSQSLAGEAAGVQVINTSGQPGESATIRIRGFGSVNGNRDPLYVLDGVPFSGSLNSINPNDIESTTILKDATATAIYGSRGANGVILLTTKSGKVGTSAIEVDIKTGVNVSGLPRYSTIKSPEEYIGLSWEAMYNKGVASGSADPIKYANDGLFSASGITPSYNLWNATGAALIDPTTRTVKSGVTRKYDPESWEDYGFQNSSRTEANLTFRGGTETSKYYTSFGYLNDVGYIINSDFKRYNATMNLESLVKPWLSTTAKLTVAGTETNNNGQTEDSGSIFWFVDNLPPIFPLFLRDGNGAIVADPIFGGNQYDYGVGRAFGALTNSIADAHFDRSETKQYQGAGNFGGTIRFTENLTFENTFGVQYYSRKYNSLNNPFYGSAAGQGGSIFKRNRQLISYNFLSLLRYKKTFGVHNLEALVAHESNSWEEKVETMSKHKMVHPDIDDLNNFIIVSSPPTSYTDQVRLESYFGQVNYNFENKYFLSASLRRDGSSRFVGDNKWDNFGSLGLSWVLTEESFMQNLPFVNFLKYKISYGVVGEQAGIGYYPGYNTFDVSNLNDGISISARDIGNPDLTWETSKMFQTGIEFGIGKYLEGTIDYYLKNTENLLFDRRVGPSVGYALMTVNDGVLRNSGLEFDFTAHIIDKKDYEFNVTVNGEMLSNKLITMPIDPATGEPKVLDIDVRFGRAEGHSLYDFYVREWAGVDPANGTAMWYQYYHDANANSVLDSGEGISSLFEYTTANPDNEISVTTTKTYANATQKYVNKSAIPKLRGAFRLEGKVKNFDASAQFIYSLGGYAYDRAYAILMSNDVIGGNNWSTDIRDRWQNPGDITDVPRLSSNYDINVNSNSTRFITKSDFLSLNNVRIGYTVPKQITDKLKMSSLNVFVSGDNLFLLSARDGFNPSTDEAGTSDMYRYSPLSTYTLGLKVKF
ncbi:MAG: SusC/RagA family TonB-linked outer membrane protein [Bacteroidetes bacterium GWF2_42_66]|nr:MAG: SusC/RagA family TonB-linked outer membrane protein [Bacteroidetes bacterium GWA2_42_15]OFX99720.1 MAG: SusC/RagA family TonB-linked outer membrane protein [Bacteroidetes bacterium GWE2_42_39]OFY39758.1 MAG: SusC/RagA family TonB-linked outer membrane protein [Bacteroidetes bacterium GWF2_42_66]HBL74824.1 SusC/RagA family TonB-linked outer membrane protein [Prolixibacteraceae bacterium]HCR90577.1 SusC/RagA family TonB-linked outer membrane protein [Prolixibacteraceae bacterium]